MLRNVQVSCVIAHSSIAREGQDHSASAECSPKAGRFIQAQVNTNTTGLSSNSFHCALPHRQPLERGFPGCLRPQGNRLRNLYCQILKLSSTKWFSIKH